MNAVFRKITLFVFAFILSVNLYSQKNDNHILQMRYEFGTGLAYNIDYSTTSFNQNYLFASNFEYYYQIKKSPFRIGASAGSHFFIRNRDKTDQNFEYFIQNPIMGNFTMKWSFFGLYAGSGISLGYSLPQNNYQKFNLDLRFRYGFNFYIKEKHSINIGGLVSKGLNPISSYFRYRGTPTENNIFTNYHLISIGYTHQLNFKKKNAE